MYVGNFLFASLYKFLIIKMSLSQFPAELLEKIFDDARIDIIGSLEFKNALLSGKLLKYQGVFYVVSSVVAVGTCAIPVTNQRSRSIQVYAYNQRDNWQWVSYSESMIGPGETQMMTARGHNFIRIIVNSERERRCSGPLMIC